MPMYQPRQTPEIFLQFLFGYRSIEDVERFIYEHDNLKEVIGYVWEDEFLSFHFREPRATTQLRTLIHQFIQDTPSTSRTENIIWKSDIVYISRQLIQGDIPLHIGAQRLWSEWFHTHRQPWEDPDFAAFGKVDAAIEDYYEYDEDDQQVGNTVTIQTISERYRSEMMQASRNLIRRFDPYNSNFSKQHVLGTIKNFTNRN